MSDVIFADGLIVKEGKFHEGNAHLRVSIAVPDFAKFVKDNTKDGWLNLEIKTSKGGKVYACLDTFVPKKQEESSDEDDSLPF